MGFIIVVKGIYVNTHYLFYHSNLGFQYKNSKITYRYRNIVCKRFVFVYLVINHFNLEIKNAAKS